MKYRIALLLFLCLTLSSCIPSASNAPTFTSNPQNQTITAGETYEFTPNLAPVGYALYCDCPQWLKVDRRSLKGISEEGVYVVSVWGVRNGRLSDKKNFRLVVLGDTAPVTNPATPVRPVAPVAPQPSLDSISTISANNGVIIIPEGSEISLDTDLDIRALEIKGKLVCADKDIEIRTRLIYVDSTGTLECGTATNPYTKNFDVILRGGATSDNVQMGTHFISSRGILSLHGTVNKAWTRLGANANRGQSTITLSEAIDVRVGDSIVISSSSVNMNEAEVRTVLSVNGRTLALNNALQFNHDGTTSEHNHNGQTWTLDNRASVGILSRNITISAIDSGRLIGGHIMSSGNGKTFISGIELRNMGQGFNDVSGTRLSPLLARYPIHFHLQGNLSGQYFNNSSIVDSNNRCVVIHGSNNATVSGNVCFRHLGHGFFTEDANETGNSITNNLGLLSMRVSGTPILETDNQNFQTARGPSTFWISNTDNFVNGNVAAGSEGTAFWYFTETAANSQRFGSFNNNTAHSSSMAYSSCTANNTQGIKNPSNEFLVNDLTVFSSGFNTRRPDGTMNFSSAMWPCGSSQTFRKLIVQNSGGDIDAGNNIVAGNSTFITPTEMRIDQSLFIANDRYSNSAIGIYDGGFIVTRSHFEGYTGTNSVFGTLGASTKKTSNRLATTTFSTNPNMIRTHVGANGLPNSQVHRGGASIAGSNVHDLDGSIARSLGVSFSNPSVLTVNHGLMSDASCSVAGVSAYCPYRLGNLRLEVRRGAGLDTTALPLSNPIFSGVDGRNYNLVQQPSRPWYQENVRVNSNDIYYFSSASLAQAIASTQSSLNITLRYVFAGDSVIVGLRNLANKPVVGYPRVANLAALRAATRGYFYSGGVLYVKGTATGGNWNGSFSFTIR